MLKKPKNTSGSGSCTFSEEKRKEEKNLGWGTTTCSDIVSDPVVVSKQQGDAITDETFSSQNTILANYTAVVINLDRHQQKQSPLRISFLPIPRSINNNMFLHFPVYQIFFVNLNIYTKTLTILSKKKKKIVLSKVSS